MNWKLSRFSPPSAYEFFVPNYDNLLFTYLIGATKLTLEQMKPFVKDHFEDFVNKRNAAVIRKNMTADFHDHDGPGGKLTDVAGDEQMMVGSTR